MIAKPQRGRLGVVTVFAGLLLVGVLVGGPYIVKRRIKRNEAIALVSLRKIIALTNAHMEQKTVGSVCGQFSSNAHNDTLEQAQVRAVFEEALKYDYHLEFRNCSQAAYRIVAQPVHFGPIAPYTFCSDQSAVIHFVAGPSTCDDSRPIWHHR